MNRKKSIITSNRELYEKLNMLNLVSEVLLRDVKNKQLDRIMKNINKECKVLDKECVGKYIVLKKINPINYNVYLQ